MTLADRNAQLENAIEAILEHFDIAVDNETGFGKAWVEVEVEVSNDAYSDGNFDAEGEVITEGQVSNSLADALIYANTVLYENREQFEEEEL